MDALHYHDAVTGQYYLHPREVRNTLVAAGVGDGLADEIVGALLRRAYDADAPTQARPRPHWRDFGRTLPVRRVAR